MFRKNKLLKLFGNLSYALSTALLIASLVFNLVPASPALADRPTGDLQLNLSHIECVDGEVEIHFVLLNVPDGVTPGTLTYTYGSIEPGKNTGNVWHYTDYQPSGNYDVQSASVEVNGQTVTLHNPGAYAGNYNCGEREMVTICYNDETMTVPVDDLDQYPGYTEGTCPTPPEEVTICFEGVTMTVPVDDLDQYPGYTLGTCPTPPDVNYQLNLSHIECVDGEVEIHFVLLNVEDGITPGTLTYTYGTIEPGKHTGNVWHYTDYQPNGSYDIQSASVLVNGVTVNLHNPGAYAGDYNCGESELVTICYENETMTVPVEDLDLYPGYAEGACVPELPKPEASYCFSPVLSEFKVNVVNNGAEGFIGFSTDGGKTIETLVGDSLVLSKDASSLLLYARLDENGAWGDPSSSVDLDQNKACAEDPMELVYFCSEDSENPNGWRVTNLNDFDVKITWSIEDGPSSVSEILILAGEKYEFSTPYYAGKMKVFVNGVLQASADPENCEQKAEKLELTAVCLASDTYHGWTVNNPNPFEVGFEYTLDGYTIFTEKVAGNASVSFKTEKSQGNSLTLFASGVQQAKANAVSTCPVNDPPVEPPTTPPVVTPPPTVTTNTTVLIPVTGLDMGASSRTSRNLLRFGLGLLGLGMVLNGLARKHKETI